MHVYVQGALLSSDSILTVSKSYANEITQDPGAACGLHDVLNSSPVRYGTSTYEMHSDAIASHLTASGGGKTADHPQAFLLVKH